MEWVALPFAVQTESQISDVDLVMKEEYISLRADPYIRAEFAEMKLDEFWIAQLAAFPKLAHCALSLLVGFPISWECEAGFSQVGIIHTKHRSRLMFACP